jgi:hypothetical protein
MGNAAAHFFAAKQLQFSDFMRKGQAANVSNH